jgi:MFS family permease
MFFAVSIGMAVPWGFISLIIWLFPRRSDLVLFSFLTSYGLGSVMLGCVTLLSGIMYGKLVSVRTRGRLIGISSFLGCIAGSLLAALLMPRWLGKGLSEYAYIFGTTTAFFTASAIVITPIIECRDTPSQSYTNIALFVRKSLMLVGSDRNFRRFMCAMWMLSMNSVIFPHYTAYVKARGDMPSTNYMLFVVVQNLSNALNSLLMGSIADRKGNRLVLKLLISIIGVTPLVTIFLGTISSGMSGKLFLIVYALIGLAPVTNRLSTNFLLELSPPGKHTQYLGAMNLLRIAPVIMAPFVGWLIDILSFESIVLSTSALIFCGVWVISYVDEPRLKGDKTTEAI